MNIPEGWKLVPVEPTPAMTAAYSVAAEELTKRHLLSGSYPATWQLIEAGYAAMLRSAPTPPAQQDDEAIVLTERQKAIVSFALWRFINDAYSQATYYAQNGPVEHVSRFQDDAKDAEAIRALLTKRGAA